MPRPRKDKDPGVALADAVADAAKHYGLKCIRCERMGAWGLRVTVQHPTEFRYSDIHVGPLMEDSKDRVAIDDALYDAFIEKLHELPQPDEVVERVVVSWKIRTNRGVIEDEDYMREEHGGIHHFLNRVRAVILENMPVSKDEEWAASGGMSKDESEVRVAKLQYRYGLSLRAGHLPTSAACLARRLAHLHDLHDKNKGMPWTTSWLAEQALSAIDEEIEHENKVLLSLTEDQALALRNVILPRLVDLEQHGYGEEYDGEGRDLRAIGNVLEAAVRRSSDRPTGKEE